jgi:uncharacterized membrane protein YoaK (UPF0700 family)
MMALIAGYVDAIGDPSWEQGWRPGLSMVMFVFGVAVGFGLGAHLSAARRTPTLLGIEAVLLLVFAAVAGNVEGDIAPIGGSREVFLLTVSSIAMGVATDVVRRVAGVAVYTTFQTGTIARLAETGAAEVEHALGVPGAPAVPPEARRVLTVLGAVIGGYIVGSAIGAAVVSGRGYALWVPAIVCTALVVVTAARPDRADRADAVPGSG